MATLSSNEWEKVLGLAAPHGKPWIIAGFAEALPAICDRFEINTTDRQAHFLAQVIHESDGLKTTEEYASGRAYEGRKDLGNIKKGDGVRHKGRGLIQLTGRYNYGEASQAMGHDFLAHPEDAAKFPWAADVAGWYWDKHSLNRHADRNDVRAITKAINGGYLGLDSRTAYLQDVREALA